MTDTEMPTPDQPDNNDAAADSPSPTSAARRRFALWAVAAASVVVLLVAGALLTARDDAVERDTSSSGARQEAATATDTGGSSAGTGRSKTPSGSAGSLSPKERKRLEALKKRGGDSMRPTAPAQAGARLTTVTVPPARTVVMLSADSFSADALYNVSFRPFGPAVAGRPGYVVRIDNSKALNAAAQKRDFAGRTLFASVETTGAGITLGGAYRAELAFEQDGESITMVLRSVHRIR